jgi:hypothetical protein
MDELLDLAIPGVGMSLGMQKLRAKRRNVVIGSMFEHDGSRRSTDEDGEEIDLHDPDAPGYRKPQAGEKPSPRAQWDDVRNCWVEWSKADNDWIVVGEAADTDAVDEETSGEG